MWTCLKAKSETVCGSCLLILLCLLIDVVVLIGPFSVCCSVYALRKAMIIWQKCWH